MNAGRIVLAILLLTVAGHARARKSWRRRN